ncbi:MAG: hypothetical protein ABIT08_17815 [Bacteroidia bacterium]
MPLLLLVAGLYLTPIQIFQTNLSKVPGDFGDARFNNYILEHGYNYLTGKVDKFWDAPFMYPYKNVIAFSDNLLGTLPIYSVFRASGFDRETSFQLWLFTLFVLNFICCYLALNHWIANSLLAATGAYIFAFSIFIVGNIYNVQTFPRFIVPFVFFWIWKYFSEKRIEYFLFTSIGVVFQFYCGIYLGFLLVYSLLFLTAAYLIIYRDKSLFTQFKIIKQTIYFLLIILLTAVLLTPLMLPYIKASEALAKPEFKDMISTIPTLRSYFFTSKAPIVWGLLSEHGTHISSNWWFHFLFIGGLPWLGIIAVPFLLLSKDINPAIKKSLHFWTLALFLSLTFCLNINGLTLYRIIYEIPGFSSMRSMNRIMNIEVFFFILIFVFVFNELSKSYRMINGLILSFPLLIIIDNLIDPKEIKVYDKGESQKEIQFVKEKIMNKYNKNYIAIAFKPKNIMEVETERQLDVMLATQELNISCVNAYTGYSPTAFIDFYKQADRKALNKWCEFNHLNKNLILKINESDSEWEDYPQINLKAENDKYICADKSLNYFITANRDKANQWETFTLIPFKNNKYALLSFHNLFLSCDSGCTDEINALSKQISEKELFEKFDFDHDLVSFKAINGKYLSVDKKSYHLCAKSNSISKEEKFILEVRKDE